ncbi:hypothetical protein AVEN_137490-1, partial [Araneus ventricosus]
KTVYHLGAIIALVWRVFHKCGNPGSVCVKLIGSRVRWAEGGAVRAGFTDSSRFGLAAQDEQETFSQHSPSYLRPDVHGKNRDYHLYAGRYLCGPGKNTNR